MNMVMVVDPLICDDCKITKAQNSLAIYPSKNGPVIVKMVHDYLFLCNSCLNNRVVVL